MWWMTWQAQVTVPTVVRRVLGTQTVLDVLIVLGIVRGYPTRRHDDLPPVGTHCVHFFLGRFFVGYHNVVEASEQGLARHTASPIQLNQ